MKVLQVHNEYASGHGGEDSVLSCEADMLRKRGHTVEQLVISNTELSSASFVRLVGVALETVWSRRGYRLVTEYIDRYKPDILHFHNTFPLLSPSVYWAAKRRGCVVVQTLHNYRIACASSLLARGDRYCEDCIGKTPLPAIKHRCYRNSLAATLPLVAMQTVHRLMGTYSNKVDRYIVLTEFARSLMERAGLPGSKLVVKPNFVTSRGHGKRNKSAIVRFVFSGTLISYKGVDLLLEAWDKANISEGRLLLLGDGPERKDLQRRYAHVERVEWMGRVSHEGSIRIIGSSDYLVVSSKVVEGLSMVLLESLSVGTPAIVPNHGAFPHIVVDGKQGVVYQACDLLALSSALQRAAKCSEDLWLKLSEDCIRAYESYYTERANIDMLEAIYFSLLPSEKNYARSAEKHRVTG